MHEAVVDDPDPEEEEVWSQVKVTPPIRSQWSQCGPHGLFQEPIRPVRLHQFVLRVDGALFIQIPMLVKLTSMRAAVSWICTSTCGTLWLRAIMVWALVSCGGVPVQNDRLSCLLNSLSASLCVSLISPPLGCVSFQLMSVIWSALCFACRWCVPTACSTTTTFAVGSNSVSGVTCRCCSSASCSCSSAS